MHLWQFWKKHYVADMKKKENCETSFRAGCCRTNEREQINKWNIINFNNMIINKFAPT